MDLGRKKTLLLLQKLEAGVSYEILQVEAGEPAADGYRAEYRVNTNGGVERVTYSTPTVQLEVSQTSSRKEGIRVVFVTNGRTVSSTYNFFRFRLFRFLDPVWRKYRAIFSSISKFDKIQKAEKKKVADKKDSEEFNELFARAFPEEIEKILLGDNENEE
jgi:hypothetical protein